MISPQESRHLLFEEMKRRGSMSIQDVLDFEKEHEKEGVWLGMGIIMRLIRKVTVGHLEITPDGKFTNPFEVPPSVR